MIVQQRQNQIPKTSIDSSSNSRTSPSCINASTAYTTHDQQQMEQEDQQKPLLQGINPIHKKQQSYSVKGILFMCLAVISFHLLRVFVKLCYTVSNISVWQIMAFRAGVNGVLNLIVIAFLPHVHLPGVPKHLVWYMIARIIIGFISFTLVFASLQYLNFSTSMVIWFIYPMITAVAGRLFLKQKLSIYDVVALCISFFGIVLFAFPEILGQELAEDDKKVENLHIGIILGVIQTFFMAGVILTIRRMGKQIHFTISPTYFGCCGGILFALISLINYLGFGHVTNYNSELYLYLFLSGLVGFVGQNCMSIALQNEKAGRLAGLEYIQVVFGFLMEIIVFKGKIGVAQIVGSVLIAGSSFLVTILKCTGKIK